jgi:peptidoglycan/LPS O-acetylase OafA/YrhL
MTPASHHTLYNTLSLIKLFGACLVMTTHLGQQYWGISFYSFGTGCFFVVSGFYALNWRREHGIRYFISRLIRLSPAFFVAVMLYAVSQDLPLNTLPDVLFHHATFFLAASNQEQVFSLNPAFWSLPVFVTFFLLVSVLPGTYRPKWEHLCLLFTVSLLAYCAQLDKWRDGYLLLWAAPFYLHAFWLGGLCHRLPKCDRTHANVTVITLVCIIVLSGASYKALNSWIPGIICAMWQFYMVPLYALLLWALLHSSITQKPSAVMTQLAELSFGLYLFHNLPGHWLPNTWPPAILTLVTLVMTLLLAAASRRWVERPFIRWAQR